MKRAAFDIVMFVASFAIALTALNMTGCAKQNATPKQVMVSEKVVHRGWIIGHIVECDGRRYLLNSSGGIIELPPRADPRNDE